MYTELDTHSQRLCNVYIAYNCFKVRVGIGSWVGGKGGGGWRDAYVCS